MTLNRRGAGGLVVLALGVAALFAGGAPARATSPSAPPSLRPGTISAPRTFTFAAVAGARGHQGRVARAFHTPNPGAVAAARASRRPGANSARLLTPAGGTTLSAARPATASAGAGAMAVPLPLMSRSAQVSLYGQAQDVEPPDTQVAAGPNTLVEADNSTLSTWTKAGAPVSSADLTVFFGAPAGYSVTDPRLVFDTLSGRWLLSALAFDSANDSRVYLDASQTSDPSGGWYEYTVATKATVLADQPMLGVSSDKLVIAWDDYDSGGSWQGSETVVIQKSAVLSGASAATTTAGPDTGRFRLVPAVSQSASAAEWLAYNGGSTDLPASSAQPVLGLVAITGTPAAGNVAWAEHDRAIGATTAAPYPSQPGGVLADQGGDDRLISAAWINGSLWTAMTIACTPSGDTLARNCPLLLQENAAADGSGITGGNGFALSSAGVDRYYPAVGFDGAGDVIVTYTLSSDFDYPGIAAIDQPVGTPGQLDAESLLSPGSADYTGARWGDYSSVAVDPTNPAEVWLAGEHSASATAGSDWATAAIPVVVPVGLSSIQVTPADGGALPGNVTPLTASGYDAFGGYLANVTGRAAFTISPSTWYTPNDGTCERADTNPAPPGNHYCGSQSVGWYTVQANVGGITDAVQFASDTGWQQLGGSAVDVGAWDPNLSRPNLWVVGTNAVGGGFGLYENVNGSWVSRPGGGVRIAVGPQDHPVVVNSSHSIFQWTGGGWQQLPGSATDVGVGGSSSDSIWAIGTNPVGGGYGIWHYSGGRWSSLPGGGVRIAVGTDGRPYVVNSSQAIYHWTGSFWQQLPGSAYDLGVGAFYGRLWVVGTSTAPGGHGVYWWDGGGFRPVPGGAQEISVTLGDAAIVTNDADAIYQKNTPY